jgi:CubicO group peptidase (beta-lactamase class C family)
LTHSSGIPALGYSESKLSPRWFMHGLPVNSVEELITFMQGCEEWVECEPGQSWHYLNEGYILLGAIIEAVSGKPYVEYVREHILEPVGMARTCFRRQAVEQQNDVATQYMLDRAGDFFEGSNLYGEIPAAGGLVSCLNDMASFATVLLNAGKTAEGTQLVQSDTLELMFEPRVDLPYAHHDAFESGVLDDLTYSQGYGFQITKGFFGERLAAHGGGVMGGTSYLALSPAEGAAMVLLSNGHGYPLSQLALYGLARFGGRDASQLPFIKLEKTLAQYRGHYESFRGTIMADVEQKGSCLELCLVFQNEDRVVTLVPTQLGRSRARFQTFSGGRRSEVVFSQVNGNSSHTEFVYERYKFRKTQVNGDWNEEAQK